MRGSERGNNRDRPTGSPDSQRASRGRDSPPARQHLVDDGFRRCRRRPARACSIQLLHPLEAHLGGEVAAGPVGPGSSVTSVDRASRAAAPNGRRRSPPRRRRAATTPAGSCSSEWAFVAERGSQSPAARAPFLPSTKMSGDVDFLVLFKEEARPRAPLDLIGIVGMRGSKRCAHRSSSSSSMPSTRARHALEHRPGAGT